MTLLGTEWGTTRATSFTTTRLHQPHGHSGTPHPPTIHLLAPVLRLGCIYVQAKKLSSSESSQDGYVTDEDEGAGQEKLKKNNKKEGATKKHKLAKELSDLVNYCKSTRFEDFATSQQTRESVVAVVVTAVFNRNKLYVLDLL